jgi:hypothetical protein
MSYKQTLRNHMVPLQEPLLKRETSKNFTTNLGMTNSDLHCVLSTSSRRAAPTRSGSTRQAPVAGWHADCVYRNACLPTFSHLHNAPLNIRPQPPSLRLSSIINPSCQHFMLVPSPSFAGRHAHGSPLVLILKGAPPEADGEAGSERADVVPPPRRHVQHLPRPQQAVPKRRIRQPWEALLGVRGIQVDLQCRLSLLMSHSTCVATATLLILRGAISRLAASRIGQ